MNRKKILIIEDEELELDALVQKFSDEDFEVLTAEDGEIGYEKALAEKPDIILLDLLLPKLEGMDMMKKLRVANSWGKTVPIIILTNLNPDSKIIKGVAEDEPAFCLMKADFTLDQIVEKVKERLLSEW